jgi:hypothetical protein
LGGIVVETDRLRALVAVAMRVLLAVGRRSLPRAGGRSREMETVSRLLRSNGPWEEQNLPQSGRRPVVHVYVRVREFHADMVTIWNPGYAGACRVVIMPGEDPLDATTCLWHWTGSPVDAVRAVCGLTLPPLALLPGTSPYPLPAVCRPPTADCRHVLMVVDTESVSGHGGEVLRCDACRVPVGESFPRADYENALL